MSESKKLIGAVELFAIEAELVEVYQEWSFGRIRFWVAGVPIGDFEDSSDLAASARWGRTFLAASSRRTRVDLDDMTTREVYDLLYGRYIVPVHATSQLRLSGHCGHWDREPHLLDEVGESALRDKFAAVVVRRRDGVDRILAYRFDDGRVVEALVAPGECDRIIRGYCEWAENRSATVAANRSVAPA